jgi:asparagine synthetase B (glutamine-hydrolysing)
MCGFVVNIEGKDVDKRLVSFRGPDSCTTLTEGGFKFTHYLLSCTGEEITQPFTSTGIVCLYNGEIYNQSYEKSDGEVLIPLYEKYGFEFPKHIDGEFAIALYDFDKSIVVFASDPFGTKPMWVNKTEAASYLSSCPEGDQFPPNTIRVVDLPTGKTVNTYETYSFDFKNQYKTSYNDWDLALESSLIKRISNNSFVCLSSGMDSGIIACGLDNIKANWFGYTILGNECKKTISKRNSSFLLNPTKLELESELRWLKENAEPYTYSWNDYRNGKVEKTNHKNMFDDRAVKGLGVIFKLARNNGHYIHLSGQGGDEIYSDYGNYSTSELKGIYPENLTPWGNFNGNQMRDYIHKEEHIGGAYGIESRYPLLDTQLVQEFLWLSTRLKNSDLKAPIKHYLDKHHYPYSNRKIGFNPTAGLK